jgi:hypothetical protein
LRYTNAGDVLFRFLFLASDEDRNRKAPLLCLNRSHWYAEGSYDALGAGLFHEVAVDRFLLEYDDERSGTFEPLRLVPKGKIVDWRLLWRASC